MMKMSGLNVLARSQGSGPTELLLAFGQSLSDSLDRNGLLTLLFFHMNFFLSSIFDCRRSDFKLLACANLSVYMEAMA